MHTWGVFSFYSQMKNTYTKIPLGIEEQISLLKSRGLIVHPESNVFNFLSEISYYRLSAYFPPYQISKDTFAHNVSFNQIIDTYNFDKELRLIIFGCIEKIEIAIRTQFIYQMSIKYKNSHWQDNPDIFIKPYRNKIGKIINPYTDLQTIISKAKIARTPETFIKHYQNTYSYPSNPPCWMIFELLTMGELSHIYRGLKNNSDKKQIANFFELHPTVFTSWLHTLTYIRNICAHYSRLWNRDLSIEPEKLNKPKNSWVSKPFENNKRVFYTLCLIQYILKRLNPTNDLKKQLESLFNNYPNIPIKYLGIPSDDNGRILKWQLENLWKSKTY